MKKSNDAATVQMQAGAIMNAFAESNQAHQWQIAVFI